MRASSGYLEVSVSPDFDQVTRHWGDHFGAGFGDDPLIAAGVDLVDERGGAQNRISPYTEGFRLSTLSP